MSISRDQWRDLRGDRHLLKATLSINGTEFHLEAVEVRTLEHGFLEAAANEDSERLDALAQVYEARWATIPVTWPDEEDPRCYVAYAVPFDS